MAPDDNSGARPAGPVVLRIKLRYDSLDVMVQRFALNVGKSGLFLPTKSIQSIGTEVKFELRLANDTPALVGIGRVKHVKHPNPKNPKAAFGMAIELMRVSREGREVIIRMIERRRAMGLPDVAIPIPEDLESSRRNELESQPRADTSGIVREAMAQFASAPVAEAVLSGTPPSSVRDSALVPVVARDSAPLLTAPRSTELSKPVPALAPEPPRAKRPRLADVIAKAGAVAVTQVPELDEHVDVERALQRARALATGDLDAELAAVVDSVATPTEISVEAASAELARQLGGKPTTRRDRSARWAPPPAVAVDPAIALAMETVMQPPPAPIVEPPPDDDDAFAQNASTTTAVEGDGSSFERAFSEAERLNTGDIIELDPDEEVVERTTIGQMPADRLAAQLDRELDEAEQEADADVAEGMRSERSYNPYGAAPAEAEAEEEISDLDVLAEADEDDADLLHASYREPPAYDAAGGYDAPTGYDAASAAYREPGAYGQQGAYGEQGEYREHVDGEQGEYREHVDGGQAAHGEQGADGEQAADGERLAYGERAAYGGPAYGERPADEALYTPEPSAARGEDEALYTPDPSAARGEDEALYTPDPSAARGEDEALYTPEPSVARADDEALYTPDPSAARGEDEALYTPDPSAARADDDAVYAREPSAVPVDDDALYTPDPERADDEAIYEPEQGEFAAAEPTAFGDQPVDFGGRDEAPYEAPARPSSSFDFASRLDLEDSLDRALDGAEEDVAFDRDAANEFDREAAREFDAERPRNLDSVLDERPLPPDLVSDDDDDDPANEFVERPSSDSYTFAEPFPQATLYQPPADERELDDDNHAAAQPDLEDALAALDVDDEQFATQPPRRASQSSAPPPLPGLPAARPATGPIRTVAHTVPRATAPTMPASTAIRPPAPPPTTRMPASTPRPPGAAAARPPTMPPPVPAAALRKTPTQQAPVGPRATTDDGIMIEFDDDE